MAKCTNCRLHTTCNNVQMMGHGSNKPKIMVVQENPFLNESRKGKYMTGKAGRMLMGALAEIGVDIEDVYFTAVVKCNAPEDRPPLTDEIRACKDLLLAEIEVLQPEIS